jgi:hypothetical protein
MSIAASLLIIVLAGLLLIAGAGIGVLVLMRLGVITKYAFKQESPDTGQYQLDQSQEAGDNPN